MKNKKWLIWVIITIVICLLITPITYIINFAKHNFSDNPHDWGVFGDYLGGVLNPIISLLSTFVLASLTYFVYKNSNIENRKYFTLEQKLLAFQYISRLSNNIELVVDKINLHNDLMCKAGEFQIKEEIASQYFKAMESVKLISEFKVGIRNFERNYGHLFTYNFNSEEYQELQKLMKQYFDQQLVNSEKNRKIFELQNISKVDESKVLSLLSGFLSTLQKDLQKELNNAA